MPALLAMLAVLVVGTVFRIGVLEHLYGTLFGMGVPGLMM